MPFGLPDGQIPQDTDLRRPLTIAAGRTGPAPLSVTTEPAAENGWVVRVSGDLDLTTISQLRGRLAAHLNHRQAEVLVLDLTRVSFLAACGLALLVEVRDWAHAAGTTLRVLPGTTRAVLRPLQATGLDQLLPLATTHADAPAVTPAQPAPARN